MTEDDSTAKKPKVSLANRIFFYRQKGNPHWFCKFDTRNQGTSDGGAYLVITPGSATTTPSCDDYFPVSSVSGDMTIVAERNLLLEAYSDFCAACRDKGWNLRDAIDSMVTYAESFGEATPGCKRAGVKILRKAAHSVNKNFYVENTHGIQDSVALNHLSASKCVAFLQHVRGRIVDPCDYQQETTGQAFHKLMMNSEQYSEGHVDEFGDLENLEVDTALSSPSTPVPNTTQLPSPGEPNADELLAYLTQAIAAKKSNPITQPAQETVPPVDLGKDSKIHIPTSAESYKPTDDVKTCYKLIDNYKSVNGKPLFMLVLGPTGCGKTTAAQVKAHKDKRHLLVVDCSAAQEPTDLFGGMTAKNGSTDFILSDLPKATQVPGCIIVLDEVNRATHEVRNSLLALLDARGETTIPGVVDGNGDSVHISVRPDVCFMATANIGAGYAGTEKIDSAFRNRATATIRVNYLSMADEAKMIYQRTGIDAVNCKIIAKLCAWTRKEANKPTGGEIADPIATRTAFHVAEMVKDGIPLDEAVQVGVVNNYDDSEDRKIICKQYETVCDQINAL